MECVILFRDHADKVSFIYGKDPTELAVFPNHDEAVRAAERLPLLQKVVWQIVEVNEL